MKFKVGDKVKITGLREWNGEVGVIVESRPENCFPYNVQVPTENYAVPVRETEIELINAAPVKRYKVTHYFTAAEDAIDFMIKHGGTASPA